MKTPPPDKQPAVETLEEIAHRITAPFFEGPQLPTRFAAYSAILSALCNERERAVRIIDEHQALDVCKDNCWTTIKAAIREGR